jgi:hypothetical protein
MRWKFTTILFSLRKYHKVIIMRGQLFVTVHCFADMSNSLWLSAGPSDSTAGIADPSWITFPQLWAKPGVSSTVHEPELLLEVKFVALDCNYLLQPCVQDRILFAQLVYLKNSSRGEL